jgi:hypothetical protein
MNLVYCCLKCFEVLGDADDVLVQSVNLELVVAEIRGHLIFISFAGNELRNGIIVNFLPKLSKLLISFFKL